MGNSLMNGRVRERGGKPGRLCVLALAGFLAAALIAGCGSQESSDNDGGTTAVGGGAAAGKSASDTGRLVIKGSDTLLPLGQRWAQAFSQKNPDMQINVTGGGSSTGIVALINGTCDIANSSREIKDKEKEQAGAKGVKVNEVAVARDGITIVVHPSNPVRSLTLAQVAGIYKGEINNWKEIGGPDRRIVASGRDAASGTYGYFQEDVLDKAKYRSDMISTPSNNQIANNVAGDPAGIGYIGVAYAGEFTQAGKVKEVPIAFKSGDTPILPTPENILAGKYPISRALLNYTNGEPTGAVKAYLDFVLSADGQKVVEEIGYVPVGKK
jgi:phosphate transport system substrate-binding protein